MLLSLTLAPIILFLLLEPSGAQIHMTEYLVPLRWVKGEVFIMYHGLAQARCDTLQEHLHKMMVRHLSINIKYINLILLFLECTSLVEITDLVKSPVRFIVVPIVLPNGILNLSSSHIPASVCFAPFPCLSFCAETHIRQTLLLVTCLSDGDVIIYLNDPSVQVLHITTEFGRWQCLTCYHFQAIVLLSL